MVAIDDLQLWICYRFPGGLFLSKRGAVSSLQISFVARPHKLSDACKRSDAKSESAAAQTNHDTHDLSLAAVIWAPALPVALERLMICSFGYATDFLVAFSFRSVVQYHRCRFLAALDMLPISWWPFPFEAWCSIIAADFFCGAPTQTFSCLQKE